MTVPLTFFDVIGMDSLAELVVALGPYLRPGYANTFHIMQTLFRLTGRIPALPFRMTIRVRCKWYSKPKPGNTYLYYDISCDGDMLEHETSVNVRGDVIHRLDFVSTLLGVSIDWTQSHPGEHDGLQ